MWVTLCFNDNETTSLNDYNNRRYFTMTLKEEWDIKKNIDHLLQRSNGKRW